MKLKNISSEEQKAMPPDSEAFACAPGGVTPELSEATANDLLSLPSVWELVDVKHSKSKKEK